MPWRLLRFALNKKHPEPRMFTFHEKLGSQYGVEGYPTVLLMDASGKVFGKTGYQRGGGKPFVEDLTAMLAKQKK